MSADDDDILYVDYTDESMLEEIQVLVAKDLSEPYSVFTYRYFLHSWPSLCVCVYSKNENGRGIYIYIYVYIYI
jgi:peptide alpha-N-acetyltransferase